ncbi:MAG TPA: HD domain-containing protein [Firmicutes bacterium]|jgi:tRNA nucleotidyltransferase (CCA-adding enzyme)|nr:HD domain-containing protein [Bacillota bacterium]
MLTVGGNRHARTRRFREWRPGIRRVLPRIPGEVMAVIAELKARGFQAFLVGGALRDLFLGREPEDWDVATSALPGQVEEVFPGRLLVHTGKRFGTVRVLTGEIPVDVTTFRREGTYTDGRRPDWVEFEESVVDDLSRRDFTVNAMALDPLAQKLVDPFRGRGDLRRRVIRTVGDPQSRFSEDALRMLRFYRFQAVLNFRGEAETERVIAQVAAEDPSLLAKVSPERVREELNKLLTGVAPGKALRGLVRTGLLTIIAPEFTPVVMDPELMEHLLATVEAIKPEPHLRWAAFLHDLGKPATRIQDGTGIHYFGHEQAGEKLAAVLLERLRFSRAFTEKVLILVRRHMFPCDPGMSDTALRRLAAKVGREALIDLLELRRADIVASGNHYHRAWRILSEFASRIQALLREEKVLTLSDLAVNGRDVMAVLGLAPGPEVGRVMQELFSWVTEDPERNTRERLLRYLEEKKKKKENSPC